MHDDICVPKEVGPCSRCTCHESCGPEHPRSRNSRDICKGITIIWKARLTRTAMLFHSWSWLRDRSIMDIVMLAELVKQSPSSPLNQFLLYFLTRR
jgi:hypothetical protein